MRAPSRPAPQLPAVEHRTGQLDLTRACAAPRPVRRAVLRACSPVQPGTSIHLPARPHDLAAAVPAASTAQDRQSSTARPLQEFLLRGHAPKGSARSRDFCRRPEPPQTAPPGHCPDSRPHPHRRCGRAPGARASLRRPRRQHPLGLGSGSQRSRRHHRDPQRPGQPQRGSGGRPDQLAPRLPPCR